MSLVYAFEGDMGLAFEGVMVMSLAFEGVMVVNLASEGVMVMNLAFEGVMDHESWSNESSI